MVLDVSKAFVRPMEAFPFELEMPLEPQQIGGDEVRFEPVRLKGTYCMTDDTVRLEGTLQTTAHAPCAICLRPASAPVSISFGESFRKDANEEEDGLFRYEGKQLPLTHMVLTLVLLNLPMRFTCAVPCEPEGELKPWNEQDTVWAEEEEGGTYRPFEGLKEMLDEDVRH